MTRGAPAVRRQGRTPLSSRRRVGVDEPVPVQLSLNQRELIVENTFAGSDLTDRLRLAEVRGRSVLLHYTLSEIEELAGFVAAEANHTKDRALEDELDELFEILQAVEDRSEDELSAPLS